MNNFMIGTKFYRNVGTTSVPEIIRLKKQEGNILYFDNGGYEATVTKSEYEEMASTHELIHEDENLYRRAFDYFGIPIYQIWEALTSTDGYFIRFKVERIGLKMTLKELNDNYIRLIPDGFFTISNIQYPISEEEKDIDVLVTLHKGIEKIPSVVCRQNVIDIYTESPSKFKTVIGLSMSNMTCPKGFNLTAYMNAEKVTHFKAIAVYLDDSLNTILKYVGSLNKYNLTMRRLYDKYKDTNILGCNQNIYDLLITNRFYDDFKSLFGIFTYPIDLDLTNCTMDEADSAVFNSHINSSKNSKMTNIVYCPYDRGIDLDQIGANHLLVQTEDGNRSSKVYLVTFDTEKISE